MAQSCDRSRVQRILRQIAYIGTTKRPMVDEKSHLENAALENSYALGWFCHMLPSSRLGSIGPNFGLFAEPSLIDVWLSAPDYRSSGKVQLVFESFL